MDTNLVNLFSSHLAALSSHFYNDNVDGQRYSPQVGTDSYSLETESLADRVAIQVITISEARLKRLILEQNFSNDVHYLVEGDFALDHCPTALPEHFSVRGNLYLAFCDGLRAMSGTLLVWGDLHLDGRTDLTTLSGKLSVGRDFYLSNCPSLSRLPEDLFVGNDFYLDGCTGLTTLPENLSVKGDLHLTGCISLRTLPERLFVGGNIFLNNCTSLSALPNCIREMGRASGGRIRHIYLLNTGLSDAVIDRLGNAPELVGIQFHFERRARQPEHQFSNLEQCLAFWRALASSDAETPELDLRPDQAAAITHFMARLTGTADYQNQATRPVLAQRVMKVMSLLASNERVRDDTLDLIEHSTSSCGDRVILALDDLETLQLLFSAETLAVEKHDPTELKALGRQMMILDKIRAIARFHVRNLIWVDEIEVELALRIELSKFFKIPGSTENMLSRRCAYIDDKDIARACAIIEISCTDSALEAFLAQWEPWQKFQRLQAVPPFDQLESITVDRIDNCSLLNVKTDEMVGLGDDHFSYDGLVKSYLLNGQNPYTRTPLDWSRVVRLIEEVPTPAKNED